MRQCRITVLKCMFDRELKEKYIPDPDYGPCPYFDPGDVFLSRDGRQPAGFACQIGWRSIREEVRNMLRPDSMFPDGMPHVVCCNDGCRPVIFLLEAQETL